MVYFQSESTYTRITVSFLLNQTEEVGCHVLPCPLSVHAERLALQQIHPHACSTVLLTASCFFKRGKGCFYQVGGFPSA